jgi:murein DD-endopeptidase MepM/ murein hydrolase activator NlpD
VILAQAAIEQLAAAAGPGDTTTAAAVAMAESGGDTNAVGDQGTSFGLWQIHLPAHPDVSQACAVDAACAARAAREISNGWSNFHPWTTFQNGAYQRYLGSSPPTTIGNVQQTQDLAGQSVVGARITSPWFPGTWEVTQGWGQTDYTGEPEGHGQAHWHAGVDIGLDCGTVISLPAGLSGTAKALDNPGGYGTALIVQLDSGVDVLLGHNRQRLVQDGQQLRAGDQLTVSNNTGNSTGCHLHFEVRPRNGRYGTDVDPSTLLLGGATAALLSSGSSDANPWNPLDPRSVLWEIQHAAQVAAVKAVDAGQVALGSVLVLSGLLVTGYGLRGKTAGQLGADARRAVTYRRPERPAAPEKPPVTGAERTRVRMNLQRRLSPEAAPRPRVGPGPAR